MKTLKLKALEMTDDQGKPADYAFLIKVVLKAPTQGGLDYEQMKARLTIESELDKTEGELQLENAESKILLDLVNSHKWGIAHADLVTFIDDVREALK